MSQQDRQYIPALRMLSYGETGVLKLIADGRTNPRTAQRLFISLHTVDRHRKNLRTRFTATQHCQPDSAGSEVQYDVSFSSGKRHLHHFRL
jgi:DNA-binding CsgD family transcriptional regulator